MAGCKASKGPREHAAARLVEGTDLRDGVLMRRVVLCVRALGAGCDVPLTPAPANGQAGSRDAAAECARRLCNRFDVDADGLAGSSDLVEAFASCPPDEEQCFPDIDGDGAQDSNDIVLWVGLGLGEDVTCEDLDPCPLAFVDEAPLDVGTIQPLFQVAEEQDVVLDSYQLEQIAAGETLLGPRPADGPAPVVEAYSVPGLLNPADASQMAVLDQSAPRWGSRIDRPRRGAGLPGELQRRSHPGSASQPGHRDDLSRVLRLDGRPVDARVGGAPRHERRLGPRREAGMARSTRGVIAARTSRFSASRQRSRSGTVGATRTM